MGIGRSLSRSRLAGVSVAKPGQRRTLVEGDMLGLAALDLVLRRFGARMMRIAVNVEIACMDASDRAADTPGFGIPAHMVTDFESILHRVLFRDLNARADLKFEIFVFRCHSDNE